MSPPMGLVSSGCLTQSPKTPRLRPGAANRSAEGSEKDQRPERDAGPQGTAPGELGVRGERAPRWW